MGHNSSSMDAHKSKWPGLAKKIVLAAVIAAALSFVFIEAGIIYNGWSNEEVDSDYAIILGARVEGRTVSLSLKSRLDKGYDYLVKHPETCVVVSGGQGPGEDIAESEAMKQYLVKKGIDATRILEENRSTSTMENLMYSRNVILADGKGNATSVVIFTNDFHMMRAKMLAQRNEFQAFGISSKTPVSEIVRCYIREYFAVIKSFFVDR